jgi:hypothetical protein
VETLGRYQIVREIGRGAMGRVFLAHDPEIDRDLAIKTIHVFDGLPEVERAEARNRFLREARAAGRLLHPSIVTIFDAGEAGGVPYLAMEYVKGTTLDRHTRPSEFLPIPAVVELVAAAAEGLAFAHREGIVHRDVKPANLMRVGERSIKIMDFGLARSAATHLTQDGALLGTPSYMSPEQVRGEMLDGRSDLFSLAVVLFELLSGAKPFHGESVSSVLFRIVHEEPAEPAEGKDRISPTMAGFLRKGLAKDPAARFADGDTFARELRRAGSATTEALSADVAVAAPSVAVPPREDPRRSGARRAWFATAGAAGAAAAGVALWFLLKGVPPPPPAPVWTTVVRTEPPGLEVTVDGRPLEGSAVRYPGRPPFPTLAVASGCRRLERVLTPEDAGRDIVLVPDPTDATVLLETGVPGAQVAVNGKAAGSASEPIRLDLCVENRLEVEATGYRPGSVVVAPGATPLEARTAVAALRLEPLPVGTLSLPDPGYPVAWTVDGKAAKGRAPRLELPEGRYRVRARSESAWVDAEAEVDVVGGQTVAPALDLPRLGTLVVQTFPANAKVYARRDRMPAWVFLDDAPVDRGLAAGRYRVKVEFLPSGKVAEKAVELRPGSNPPVRFGIAEAE